ncbi:MAG: vanadium-dependent haloperoxidase [Burkholderiales bacterium]|nr:vanadium-dependent haloperoxidase [Burkholderiales bacterium]
MKHINTNNQRAVGLGILIITATVALPGVTCADVVTDWNQTALRATEIAAMPLPLQTRVMAIVHAAVYDAVNAIDRRHAVYAVTVTAPTGASMESAAATAAHDALTGLLPLQQAALDAALKTSLAQIPDGQAKSDGMRIGGEVAEKILALRKTDGAAGKAEYSFNSGAGVYQATPPMNASPVVPHWRSVKPFMMQSATQFPFAGPAEPASAAFAKDFNEIKSIGGKTSSKRTNEQTAIAIHWSGSEIPPLNTVARAVSIERKLGIADNARLFAYLNMTMADTLIAVFESKYTFNAWRPVTAIRSADLALNKGIQADATWEPLIVTPPHPEYGCAHCIATSAGVAVIRKFSGSDKIAASYVYPTLGVLRTWTSLSQIEKEVGDARVWGGVHFRTAVDHGTQVGRQIAEYGLNAYMQLVNK